MELLCAIQGESITLGVSPWWGVRYHYHSYSKRIRLVWTEVVCSSPACPGSASHRWAVLGRYPHSLLHVTPRTAAHWCVTRSDLMLIPCSSCVMMHDCYMGDPLQGGRAIWAWRQLQHFCIMSAIMAHCCSFHALFRHSKPDQPWNFVSIYTAEASSCFTPKMRQLYSAADHTY